MRYELIKRIQRLFTIVGLISFFSIVVLATRGADFAFPASQGAGLTASWLPHFFTRPQVALISGHAGNDSGAICTDAAGQTTLTEAAITAAISDKAAALLQPRGYTVKILNEFDDQLKGLQAAALLSLHADSCVDLSGYKAAYSETSAIPQTDARLTACIAQYYAAETGLHEHPETITHNMTEYHAFRKIDPATPAAILELGFLGGDQELLTEQQDRVAQGVADSLDCFLSTPSPSK
ncbi:MAG: N-acetylmuramoyl-L-alanine amidase [Caldilineaceae bacterium]